MDRNKIVISIVSLIAIFGFLYIVFAFTNKSQTTSNPVVKELTKAKKNDHIKWSKDSKNILIEFSDLQCPACKNFHGILQSIEASGSADQKITKKVKFVYRHFPLKAAHAHAEAAAYAAEAAGKQGKFFEYTDVLFETQEKWAAMKDPKNFFLEKAKDLKLDVAKFKEDATSKDVKDRVEEDFNEGLAANVNSTPTFFFNGRKMEFSSLEEFKSLLKEAK